MEGTARVEMRGQGQILVLELSPVNSEGFRDEIELVGPSQELTPEAVITVLGFVEGRVLTMVDIQLVAFSGARSVFAPKLSTHCLAEAFERQNVPVLR